MLRLANVLPHMERQKSGSIVNISSMAAIRFAPFPMLPYNASKAAVNALTRSIAMQYAPRGIRANAIMPGLIHTPMAIEGIASALHIDKQELIRARDRAVPMGHMGEAWDVAHAALFLARRAKYVPVSSCPSTAGCHARARIGTDPQRHRGHRDEEEEIKTYFPSPPGQVQ